MNCQEAKERISLVVDNRLEAEVKTDFDTHVQACGECRNEFELERLTKRLVRAVIQRASVPPELAAQIIAQLPTYRSDPPRKRWLVRLWATPRVKPTFAVGLAALIALFLFVSLPISVRHTHTSPNDNNVIHQSFNNYDAILAGILRPDIATADPGEVKAFFADRVQYPVRVPKAIDKCQLIGGMISDYNGVPLAHVVYKHDDEFVYLHQVDMTTVLEGRTMTIPEEARQQLLETGWYVLSPHRNCSLVMWVVDGILCTAVADMEKNKLIAYLSYPDE